MPYRHGNSKLDTVVERTPEIDDPFIKRYKLKEGWKVISNHLLNGKTIQFTIDEIQYRISKFCDKILILNLKTQQTNYFDPIPDVKTVCQVVITADKWEVL